MWGEPDIRRHGLNTVTFQLTRPVWGEPPNSTSSAGKERISTHSPRVGRTFCCTRGGKENDAFQLTRPVWGEPHRTARITLSARISTHSPRVGRTGMGRAQRQRNAISTHSPRVGRTLRAYAFGLGENDFNSLAPCGANLRAQRNRRTKNLFQLTRPVWGEPHFSRLSRLSSSISTHSPRVGRTSQRGFDGGARLHFNSLAPCGANQDSSLR